MISIILWTSHPDGAVSFSLESDDPRITLWLRQDAKVAELRLADREYPREKLANALHQLFIHADTIRTMMEFTDTDRQKVARNAYAWMKEHWKHCKFG